MIYTIKLFAGARLLAGRDMLQLELQPGAKVADLRERLLATAPRLRQLPPFRLAVNQQYADDDQCLHGGEEIACIPPVSGG